MKFTHKIKRLIAIILMIVTCVVQVLPQTTYANHINNDIEIEIDDLIVLTTLEPNTSQEWAIAFNDGIGYPGYFHDEVEKTLEKIIMI